MNRLTKMLLYENVINSRTKIRFIKTFFPTRNNNSLKDFNLKFNCKFIKIHCLKATIDACEENYE